MRKLFRWLHWQLFHTPTKQEYRELMCDGIGTNCCISCLYCKNAKEINK